MNIKLSAFISSSVSKITVVVLLVLALVLSGYRYFRKGETLAITGEPRLDLILHGKGVNGHKLDGQLKPPPEYILVNFWASWCPPCFEETPSLIRFAKSHKKNFLFISISQDTNEREFNGFMKVFPELYKASDLLLLDRGLTLSASYQVESLPESLIYSTRLKKYFRVSGSIDWDRPDVLSQIENGLSQ